MHNVLHRPHQGKDGALLDLVAELVETRSSLVGKPERSNPESCKSKPNVITPRRHLLGFVVLGGVGAQYVPGLEVSSREPQSLCSEFEVGSGVYV